MSDVVKRGYSPKDEEEFQRQADKLADAGRDLFYLVNRGYPAKNASVFIGNHYMLSERQRLALVRTVAPEDILAARRAKEKTRLEPGSTVYIDCFNTIISLEIAFSGSTLLRCMDGTVRDLAGLRGTYRLIDKTDPAILTIRRVLEEEKAGRAHFLIDAPVSNSGRLKARIADLFEGSPVRTEFSVIKDVDRTLYGKENVVSSDGVVLDHCRSWFNLTAKGIRAELGDYPYVEIMHSESL
ncbi:MAG: DUF434 domain-containing protein [Eubacterium sp.]|nr:DUF434 domain-containing protein [Eubacterium sp.]